MRIYVKGIAGLMRWSIAPQRDYLLLLIDSRASESAVVGRKEFWRWQCYGRPWRAGLTVVCDDIPDDALAAAESAGYRALSPDDARAIARFVLYVQRDASACSTQSRLVVACAAGASRSPSVALAIRDAGIGGRIALRQLPSVIGDVPPRRWLYERVRGALLEEGKND